MTTYNTGNPIGSTDARDLYDNAQNLDNFSNGSAASYTDRLGVIRRSLAGIEATADGVLNGVGYQVPVTYASGISLTLTSQTVDYNGVIYAPLSSALPFTTSSWGADSVKFRAVQVTDADLITYTPAGTGAVATTVQQQLRNIQGWTVNVKDAPFYAAGNGIDDDTAAIQAALNAAAGKRVYFPAGTYFTTGVTIPDNTTVCGDGREVSILKLALSSAANLVSHAGVSGSGVVIEKMQLNGNKAVNINGRSLYFVGDSVADGPALVLRDVSLCESAGVGANAESVLISSLNWVHFDNVRFVENNGSLWLSVNDSTFNALYVGNSGVSLNVPAVVLGGSNNKFFGAYFGGNGANTGSTASQVKLYGASGNFFYGCINDHANGHGYEFREFGGVESSNNQFFGGYLTSPSQNADNTYWHSAMYDASSGNLFNGVTLDNFVASRGKLGFVEVALAGNNQYVNCRMGTFGTAAMALRSAGNSVAIDCPGFNPQGPVNIPVTASPFTYTNSDNVKEIVSITTGTVSSVVKNGVTIYGETGCSVPLNPGQSITVTYSSSPVMYADRL